jgi:hypothetical protein
VDGATVREVYATITDAEAQAAAAAAAQSAPLQSAAAALASLAPLLDDHPEAADIPDGGTWYRLTEATVISLWYVRDTDHISTQLSAHDASGANIRRSINLNTMIEIVVNEDAILDTLKPADKAKPKVNR